MPTERKISQVAAIEEKLGRSTIAVTTEFRGVTVDDMAQLRAKLRAAEIEYLVVKNNLASIAADRAGRPGLRDVLRGPTGIAFGYGEIVDPPRVLHEHIRGAQLPVTITGAVTATDVFTGDQVRELAMVPPKPVLLARLLGGLNAPLHGLAYALTYHLSGLARVLDAMREKMEPSGAAPAQAEEAPAVEEPKAEAEAPAAEAVAPAEEAPAVEEPKAEAEAPAAEAEAPAEEAPAVEEPKAEAETPAAEAEAPTEEAPAIEEPKAEAEAPAAEAVAPTEEAPAIEEPKAEAEAPAAEAVAPAEEASAVEEPKAEAEAPAAEAEAPAEEASATEDAAVEETPPEDETGEPKEA